MNNLLIICFLSLSAGAVAAESIITTGSSASLLEIGRRIYQEGLLEGGAVLQGVSAAQVTLKGRQAACIGCHRKSGLGGSEGARNIRPIAGKYIFPAEKSPVRSELHKRALYAPATTRAEYTQETFAKVLRDGVDYGGHTLNRLMPRYVFNDKEVAALAAYLNKLSSHSDPGVEDEAIHFATVVMPGAKPQELKAMLDVLNAFFADKNGGSRSESRRRTVGTEAEYRSYRRWVLHVWTLTGPDEGWNAQLEQYYKKQPVFTLLSGIGGDNWRPLHDFCEQQEIPCMFPNSNLPVTDNAYYSFYFSRGMTLEAEVLAKYFSANADKYDNILQVFNEKDRLGAAAAQVFRKNMNIVDATANIIDWSFTDKIDTETLQRILRDKKPQKLVIWLNGVDLAKIVNWDITEYSPQQVFLSASMLGSNIVANPELLGKSMQRYVDKIHLIYPYVLPHQTSQHILRTKLWLRAKKIELADEQIQANTYFAVMVVGDSISHMLDEFSRDYFIERLEDMVGRSLVTSVYPRISLGPGQRFASKGAYLVKYSRQKNNAVEPVTDWIVPN